MSSAAKARARAGRGRRAPRGTGAAITAVLLVAIVALTAVILSTKEQFRVTPTDSNDLINAISTVPKSDVNGSDPVVRPPGTVRSYFTQRGRVTTVVYVSKIPLATQKQATLDLLARDGWISPSNVPPGHVSTQSDSFTAVFANKSVLLELAMTSIKDTTAVTYIIQGTS